MDEFDPSDEGNPPGAEREALRRICTGLLIIAACLLGCYALLEITARQRIGLGELARLPVIEDWYQSHASSAEQHVVVLGDSLGRSAFNARTFNEEYAGRLPGALNLASSARTYPEMLLEIGRRALVDATVILFISPVTSFSPAKLELNPRKANVYGMLGLPQQLDDNIAQYGTPLDAASLRHLRLPRWRHVLESRWRLPEYCKDSLQISLGPQRERHRYLLGDYNRDLLYPAFGTTGEADTITRQLADRLALLESPEYCGLDDLRCQGALRDVARGLADNSAHLLVVMYPLQPEYRSWLAENHPEYSAQWLAELLGPRTDILDLSLHDAAGLFRDDLHISDDASIALTLRIGEHLLAEDGGA